MARTLEVTFNASGAAQAGARARVVVVVDVVDSSTSAEAALEAGAIDVLGAAPRDARPPATVDRGGIGRRAAALAKEFATDVVVVAEPRVGSEEDRHTQALPLLQSLRTAGVAYELVSNQGAELPDLVKLEGRVVVVVSSTGGTAYDAAVAAGALGVCFATTARVGGRPGWEVAQAGVQRAMSLAEEHDADLSIIAASANSADDCLGAFELARIVIAEGFVRL